MKTEKKCEHNITETEGNKGSGSKAFVIFEEKKNRINKKSGFSPSTK